MKNEPEPIREDTDEKALIDFYKSAINDSQAVIRAVDTKMIAISAVLYSPILAFDKLSKVIDLPRRCLIDQTFDQMLSWFFVIVWALAVTVSLMGLSSQSNPFNSLPDWLKSKCKGLYYSGGNFSLSLVDLLVNRKIAANISESHYDNAVKKVNISIELYSEMIKVSYIRDIKIHRQKFAYLFAYTAFAVLFVLLCRDYK